mgnify:CR=1 FL=1
MRTEIENPVRMAQLVEQRDGCCPAPNLIVWSRGEKKFQRRAVARARLARRFSAERTVCRFDGESSSRPMYRHRRPGTMGRYSFLPDPFVAELRRIPDSGSSPRATPSAPSARGASERGLPLAQERAEPWRAAGGCMRKGGGSRLNRQGCRCPFYLGPSKGCAACEDRPLICNLFPLDIIRARGGRSVLVGAIRRVRSGAGQACRANRRGAGTGQGNRSPDARRFEAGVHGGCRGGPYSSRCSMSIRFIFRFR